MTIGYYAKGQNRNSPNGNSHLLLGNIKETGNNDRIKYIVFIGVIYYESPVIYLEMILIIKILITRNRNESFLLNHALRRVQIVLLPFKHNFSFSRFVIYLFSTDV